MKLGPALVMTPDLGEALAFYGQVLGLALRGRFENQLVFDLAGGELHVFGCEAPAPPGRHGADAGSVICFEVPAIEDAMRALSALGVRFLHARPNRNQTFLYAAFEAPGGNVHELVQRI